jgi:DNA-binding HxlR family transcriptional regulator
MESMQLHTFPPPGGADATAEPCPLRTAVGAIGGRWKPVVLYYVLKQPHGFGELSRACNGVSNKTLATQLRELERDGLVSRTVCDDARRSVSCAPTQGGLALNPVIRALIDWGDWRLRSMGGRSEAPWGAADQT